MKSERFGCNHVRSINSAYGAFITVEMREMTGWKRLKRFVLLEPVFWTDMFILVPMRLQRFELIH